MLYAVQLFAHAWLHTWTLGILIFAPWHACDTYVSEQAQTGAFFVSVHGVHDGTCRNRSMWVRTVKDEGAQPWVKGRGRAALRCSPGQLGSDTSEEEGGERWMRSRVFMFISGSQKEQDVCVSDGSSLFKYWDVVTPLWKYVTEWWWLKVQPFQFLHKKQVSILEACCKPVGGRTDVIGTCSLLQWLMMMDKDGYYRHGGYTPRLTSTLSLSSSTNASHSVSKLQDNHLPSLSLPDVYTHVALTVH